MALNAIIGAGGAGHNAAGTVLTLEQRVIYNRNLLSRLLPNLVYMPFGQVRPMPQNAGQTVQWRRFLSLDVPTAPLTEGVTPTGKALSMEQVTVVPEQFGDFIEVTDVLDLTAPDPVLIEAGQLLGEQAANLIDNEVRDVIIAGTHAQFANGTQTSDVGAAHVLTSAMILKAVRTLHNNKAPKMTEILNASTGVGTQPIAASYVGIISPATLYDLKTETNGKFVPVHQYASTAMLLPHEVGSIDEVRFVCTTNPAIKAAAGALGIDVHVTLILGRGAFGIVSPAGIENIVKDFGAGQDPLNQRATSGWKAFFKAVRLYEPCLLRIEHAVSA